MPAGKAYDQAYFDRWYRDPRRRVTTPAALARKVAMVVGVTEQLLERPVRRVLDVGCGEGPWRAVLRRLRPAVRYVGVDASPYVVRRFGRSRGIRLGSFGEVGGVGLRGRFDLVVVCDVLQYVPDAELRAGLRGIAPLVADGVAFLEAYCAEDAIEGDRRAWHHRSAAHYRRLFRGAGLRHVGMHCWAGPTIAARLHALEAAGT